MTNEELVKIYGGADLPSSLLNSITKLINEVYELGRALGSAIRRHADGVLC